MFKYVKTLTIDRTKCGSVNSTDFAFPVAGTYSYLATVANGGVVTNANGYDIGFYSDAALTTKLKWETELYTATTGAVVYWVKIPTLSVSVDTVIYLAYGDSSITTDQSDATNVWPASNLSIYHLPNGSSLTANDSTSNANNGTSITATAAAGKVDGCAAFNGSQSININRPASFNFGTSSWGIRAWINPTTVDNTTRMEIVSKDDSAATQRGWALEINGSGGILTRGSLRLTMFVSDVTTVAYETPQDTVAASTWYRVIAQRNGNALECYVNGVAQTMTAAAGSLTLPQTNQSTTTADAFIGKRSYSGFNDPFTGSIDEVNLGAAVTQSWATADYNSQNSPSTFYALGAQNAINSGNFLMVM